MASYQQVSDDPRVQASYEAMRRQGQSHNIAEMLALREPPTDQDDRRFLAGLRPETVERMAELKASAERQKVDVNGAVYLSALARPRRQRPNPNEADPQAFIRSRSDIKRLAEQRGLFVTGAVECDHLGIDRPPQDIPDNGPDPKIVEKRTRQHERRTGVKLRGKERVDYKEKLFNRLKGSQSKAIFKPTVAEQVAAGQ